MDDIVASQDVSSELGDIESPTQQSDKAASNASHDEENKKEDIVSLLMASFSGPLPPPSALAGYEKLLPGSAERLFQWVEDEAENRRALEREQLQVDNSQVTRGQWMAFILVLAALLAGSCIAVLNPTWTGFATGSIIGIGGMGSIVAIFITRERGKEAKAAKEE